MTRASGSLKTIFGWWFAATLLTLYGAIAASVYVHTRSSTQRDIQLVVKTEAETVAAYIGSSGRLDPPELAEPEREPFTIWIAAGTLLVLAGIWLLARSNVNA